MTFVSDYILIIKWSDNTGKECNVVVSDRGICCIFYFSLGVIIRLSCCVSSDNGWVRADNETESVEEKKNKTLGDI